MDVIRHGHVIKLPPSMIRLDISEFYVKPVLHAHYKLTEESLLQCIKDDKSKMLVYYAVLCLRKYGTEYSIPVLKTLINYPKIDVKVCSLLAIGAIAGSKETPYYAELLDSNFREKTYTMSVIWEVGDRRAYDAVMRYTEKILARRVMLRGISDSLYITDYLERCPRNDRDADMIERLKSLSIPLDQYN